VRRGRPHGPDEAPPEEERRINRFEYIETIGRVFPVIEEGEPSPPEAVRQEAERLEAALQAGDPRVALVRHADAADCVRVFWTL
jgi:hypothetical protein